MHTKNTPTNMKTTMTPTALPVWSLIETLQLMKPRLTILKFLIILCSAITTTAVFGQTTFIWTNSAGGDLSTAANWTPNGVPSGPNSDTMEFNGQSTGPVSATSNTGGQTGFSGGVWGLNTYLTASQVSPVTFYTTIASGASPGIRINGITIDSGAGALSLGNTSSSNALDVVMGGAAGQIHTWLNNSANPVTVYPNFRIRYGGGGAHTIIFDGTGNWNVTNYLISANNSPTVITKSGSGTMIWTGGATPSVGQNSTIQSPTTINQGTLILKSSDLLGTTVLGSRTIVNNGTLLKYDGGGSGTLSGPISGTGTLQVNSGTVTLSSGASTFTGNILLSGGEVIAGGTENVGVSGPLGFGGTISFTGGTLGFNVNNVFDYSSRFDTSASQAYSFDTGGQNVTFATGLGSSGGTLTKIGAGTLTLSGTSSYSSTTTVSAGKLAFQGSKTGSGNITIADSAALGVTATGTQVTPGTFSVGTSGGATLEFDNVNSTTTAPLAPTALSSAGTVTININSGTLAPSQSYPLLAWTSGSAPAVSLGVLNGFIGNLSTNGNSIKLNITATAYKWTGNNNSSWDLTTPNNWVQNGGPVTFANGGPALLDDTASGNTSITITGVLLPTTVTFNNVNSNYSLATSSGNDIGGSAKLTKSGSGTLTLSGGANAYTGVTTLSGGTVSVGALANGGSASDIGAAANSAANLVLNGGTLQYTGGAAGIDRLFTLGTAGGTIDSSGSGALTLNNGASLGYSGNGARTLTLSGADADGNTLAAVLADNGGATALTKSGAGRWIVSGNNTLSGAVTLAAGNLQVGAGGATGSLGSGNIVDNGTLIFNRSGSVTCGTVSGTGLVQLDGSGTVILPGNNSYSGGTTINAGTLQVGNGGATGSLNSIQPIVDNSLLIFNSTGTFNYTGAGLISGSGNVIVRGSGGKVKAIGGNTYTGWTQIDSGATFQPCEGNTGGLVSSVVTNNGTLLLVRQDTAIFTYSGPIVGTGKLIKDVNNFNAGDVTLTASNTYSGGTIIGGGGLIIGDGTVNGWIVGNVLFTNSTQVANDTYRSIVFNRGDDVTFPGNITGPGATGSGGAAINAGAVVQNSSGRLTLTGTNTYLGGTIINAGTVQVGIGGASGAIGSGPVTNNGALDFNSSANLTVGGTVTGTGSLVKRGTGTVTLAVSNDYTGITIVSNGTLVVTGGSSIGGDMDLEGGTLAAAATGVVGTLNVGASMTIKSGSTVLATLNKSLSPSNTTFTVVGTINSTGGTLKLLNAGPALVVNDTFKIFSQAVTGGGGITIVSPGFTVANNLAVDGSVTVSAILPPPTITSAVSGNQLTLSWPSSWTGGVHLQSQTNTVAKGLGTNWVTIPGTDASNSYLTTVTKTNGCVFYRLIAP